jgi:hypothetical protein
VPDYRMFSFFLNFVSLLVNNYIGLITSNLNKCMAVFM